MFDDTKNLKFKSNTEHLQNYAKVKVIGVGGGGCNAINNMVESGVMGVEFYVCNTDAQALQNSPCQNKLVLGFEITKGLGAGANPEIGLEAALESEAEIKEAISGSDMLFIAAGMGGGTGTGGAPVIAKLARDMGVLTVAVVTRPFSFEGAKRSRNAIEGLTELKKHVDSLIVISNDRLLELIGDVPFADAFREADNILLQAVQTITDLIAIPAQMNLDFADVTTVMKDRGLALIGVGFGKGENKAEESASRAILSPLLDQSIAGAKYCILNITSANATLSEVKTVVDTIKASTNKDLDIIYGMAINKHLEDEILTTIIATGFDEAEYKFEEFGQKNAYSAPKTQEDVETNYQKEKVIEPENIYESKSFTQQLHVQKDKIREAQRRSQEKIQEDIRTGARQSYVETTTRRVQKEQPTQARNEKKQSENAAKGRSTEIPSFLRRFRR